MKIIRKADRPSQAQPVTGVRLCGPGKPTKKDIEAVNEFARELARQAAIEKSLARYFELTCGHYGTRETDLMMEVWNVKGRGWHYCDNCYNWFQVKIVKRPDIPQDPMF